ncbi:MAG: HPr-rel-A system PqqD family peptide chaperone [Sphingobium sp.]|jgi:PqqD family protein of HPr-rel-A system|nr:HPr-rel-A system PqqD family peptide chaperone [Sphingobium sp.]
MRYCAAIAATLRVVAFDDLTLIYHRASGITHVLASPAPELLAALTEPLTLAELRARLVAEFELADAADGALQARLDELVAAGLVTAA